MVRPNLNGVAIVPVGLNGAIGSTGFHALRARRVVPEYLLYLVQSNPFVTAMSQIVLGVLYPAVRPSDVASFEFPVPPYEEQQRIVAEIEKHLTRLDAAVAALKRAQANLRRYRASVLKAACEGRLVPQDRNGDIAHILWSSEREWFQSSGAKRAGRLWGAGVVPELLDKEVKAIPETWAWAKVRDLGYIPTTPFKSAPCPCGPRTSRMLACPY